jgi:hypothetical protein
MKDNGFGGKFDRHREIVPSFPGDAGSRLLPA